jgi:nickel/cobalt exporter
MVARSSHPAVRRRYSPALAAIFHAAILLSGLSPRCAAQNNPFFSTPPAAKASPSVSVPVPRLQFLIDAQRTLRETMAEAVERSASGAGVPALLGLAFAYGLLHALGPGHRKLALAAYFVARPAHPMRGVTAGISVAFLHAAAALVIIYGLYFLFKRAVTTAFSSVSSILELASYGAIFLLGLVLFLLALRESLRARTTANASRVGSRPSREARTLTAIILGSGVVPCPGTALILIFCLSQGLPWIGALAALAMSLGMAVVTVSVALATILGKRGLLSVLPRGSRLVGLFHHGLEIGGALLIMAFGLFMLSPYLVGLLA